VGGKNNKKRKEMEEEVAKQDRERKLLDKNEISKRNGRGNC